MCFKDCLKLERSRPLQVNLLISHVNYIYQYLNTEQIQSQLVRDSQLVIVFISTVILFLNLNKELYALLLKIAFEQELADFTPYYWEGPSSTRGSFLCLIQFFLFFFSQFNLISSLFSLYNSKCYFISCIALVQFYFSS